MYKNLLEKFTIYECLLGFGARHGDYTAGAPVHSSVKWRPVPASENYRVKWYNTC